MPPRLQSVAKQEEIERFLEEALRLDLIERCNAEAWSQVHLQRKPNGKWRFCVDYRALNEVSRSMGWPIPNIKQMLERIGAKRPKFFAVLDLTSGFHQAFTKYDSV